MSQHVGPIVDLVDTEQRQIGQMHIERQEDDLLWGTFVPGPAFPSVAQLFHAFEAAVEVQALHVIEPLDAAIAALGLHLQRSNTREPIAVQDVQIWSDGTITCRLYEQPVASVKTTLQSQSSRQMLNMPPDIAAQIKSAICRPEGSFTFEYTSPIAFKRTTPPVDASVLDPT